MADNSNQDSSNGNENNLTVVYRPMKLTKGITYRLISAMDMEIESARKIKVPANNVTIFKPDRKHINVKVNEHLGEDFVTGWNKLPNELRLEITKYLVLARKPIRHPTNFPDDHTLSLARRSIPDIAQNAEAKYYKHNTFRIYRTDDYFPAAMRPLVCTLFVDTYFFGATNFWPFLEQIADGTTGFTNLKHLTLQISFARGGIAANHWEPKEPVVLNCKGEITVGDIAFRYGPTYWRRTQEL